jgi:tRNA-splicing ligase RtcB
LLSIQGKYNKATIMIDTIDEATNRQIQTFVNHPAFKDMKIVIMPDCHAGIGAVVGFTATMNEKVIPNIIGVDIGCGVDVYRLNDKEVDFTTLDHFIRQHVPCGASVHNDVDPSWNEVAGFKDLLTGVKLTAERTGQETGRVVRSFGTLGGGNHFIEVDKDDSGYFLTIHSGSRNFGLKVANYHQQNAGATNLAGLAVTDARRELAWLEGKAAQAYLDDMAIAQRYAAFNRYLMAKAILEGHFKLGVTKSLVASSVHNYINFTDRIIRKGAIEAYADRLLVIPFNMRDGIALGYGLGNTGWNYSAPHGAGRIMSRMQARAKLALADYRRSMDGIWSSCIDTETIDEAPMVYKERDVILTAIRETVKVTHLLKPVYNFKAQESGPRWRKNRKRRDSEEAN